MFIAWKSNHWQIIIPFGVAYNSTIMKFDSRLGAVSNYEVGLCDFTVSKVFPGRNSRELRLFELPLF